MPTKKLYAQNQEETARILWAHNEEGVAWKTETSQGLLRRKGTQNGMSHLPPTCPACMNE